MAGTKKILIGALLGTTLLPALAIAAEAPAATLPGAGSPHWQNCRGLLSRASGGAAAGEPEASADSAGTAGERGNSGRD